jgi:hypothetical protein
LSGDKQLRLRESHPGEKPAVEAMTKAHKNKGLVAFFGCGLENVQDGSERNENEMSKGRTNIAESTGE